MNPDEMEVVIKNLDDRTSRIEQILPTLATKEDLKAFATKEDLKVFPTREEWTAIVREEGERTRIHFDLVAEDMKASIKRIAEGHEATNARVDGVRAELKADIAGHDRRI